MLLYKHVLKNTGVVAYETGEDYIKVAFRDGTVYLYNYTSAGRHNVEQMKKLAAAGKGLTTFINQTVKKHYAKKLADRFKPSSI